MPDAKANKSKRIFLFLRVTVVVGGIILAIIWASEERRWAELKAIFGQMSILVFAGTLGIFLLSQLLVGFRWWLLLRTQRIFIGYWAAARLYLLGWFYNNVMPSSVGGDLVRLWYVTKHTDKKFEAALSVPVDRMIGLLSTLVIAAFFYIVFLRSEGKEIDFVAGYGPLASLWCYRWWLLSFGMALTVIFIVLLLFGRSRIMLKSLWSHFCEHAATALRKLGKAGLLYGKKPASLLAAFGLTIVLQIVIITGFWFLGSNLGIEASIKYYYVFFTLVWVIGAIPVSIGGAVVVEVVLASLFVKFAGVDETSAAALALCQRLVWLMASLPGAVIHLIGAHLPKDFFVDYDQVIN
ncbi:MAG: flippase-like domain-containing protein [Phycisphaerales bacterium]|nr:MAG: flippase-like domain-containing protein [Phycisphaerales bacterium]